MQAIKHFYNQYVYQEERVIFYLIMTAMSLAIIFLLVNMLHTRYPGNAYMPASAVILAPFIIFTILLGLYSRNQRPRAANFFRGYGILLLCIMICGLTSTSIQFTPFAIIDSHLISVDQWLRFDTNTVVNWTFTYTNFTSLLNACYQLLTIEVVATPIILILLGNNRQFDKYVCAWLITWIIGTLIYYFFPTIGPAAMFHNSHFAPSQYATILKFNEIHHYLPVTTMAGGMIVFPSFHVIWACLSIYAFSRSRWWVLTPVVIFNLLIIASTILLGRHYPIDAIGSVIVTAIAIYCCNKLLSPKPKQDYLAIKDKTILFRSSANNKLFAA